MSNPEHFSRKNVQFTKSAFSRQNALANFHDFFLFYRSSRHHSGDYSEETGYVYRASATPDYPTAPPYNPEYPAHQNPYIAEQYPTGVIPPTAEYRQPLIQQQPPPYHDVITARR